MIVGIRGIIFSFVNDGKENYACNPTPVTCENLHPSGERRLCKVTPEHETGKPSTEGSLKETSSLKKKIQV